MLEVPEAIESEEQRIELLTRPSVALIAAIRKITDPLMIIGAGGKMGPTLAALAKRAASQAGHPLRVIAASRFTDTASRDWLEEQGVETRAVDMFEREQVASLPDAAHVVYLVGMKFGTSSNPCATWAANTVVPMLTAERYAGSKIVALSTGNVYPMSPIAGAGSSEDDPLMPLGEYANAAVARERVFGFYAGKDQTPTVMVRLNYAHDLRYGVLTDIAHKVWHGKEIDLSMGYFNAIWQGDANEFILRCFSLCSVPVRAINLTSCDKYRVLDVAQGFGELLDRTPKLIGEESPTALLSNASLLQRELGEPRIGLGTMMKWIAHWTRQGGSTLGKPTHFEVRNGKY